MFLGCVLSGFTATTFKGNYILNTRTLLCHSSKPVGEISSPNGHIVGNITFHLTVPVWSDPISCWTTQDEDKLPLNMPFDFEIWPYYVVDGPSTRIRWFSPWSLDIQGEKQFCSSISMMTSYRPCQNTMLIGLYWSSISVLFKITSFENLQPLNIFSLQRLLRVQYLILLLTIPAR